MMLLALALSAQESLESMEPQSAEKVLNDAGDRENSEGVERKAEPTEVDKSQNKQRELYMLRAQAQQLKEQKEAQENLLAKNGFFIGGIVGNSSFVSEENAKKLPTHPVVIGLKGGYQKFIGGSQAGIRAYVDYIAGIAEIESALGGRDVFYQNAAFNVDFMGDIMLDRAQEYGLSLFGGFGLGALGVSAKGLQDYYGGVFVNLGAGVILSLQHRVNLHLKIPPVKNFRGGLVIGNMFLVSYEYVF